MHFALKMNFTWWQLAAIIRVLMVCGKTFWRGGFAELGDLTVSCQSLRTGAAHRFSIKHKFHCKRRSHLLAADCQGKPRRLANPK